MMIIFWLILGALMASSFWFIYIKFQVKGKMSGSKWILSVISVIWGAFTIAWIVSSLGEGEPQAAGMGLLIFGAILIVLILLTIRSNLITTRLFPKKSANTTKTV
jgi:tryptophan-rich sensory protein